MSLEFTPMTISNQDMVQQLSGQLHLVSEIAESLTLRLLALEERFNELSVSLKSAEQDQSDDSDSFSLLADSSDRLVQLRGLLNERAEEELQHGEGPRLEVVIDAQVDSVGVDEDPEEFDLEQTVYVNDSQELSSETVDQHLDQNDELLSA